jgi:hypothetical protein
VALSTVSRILTRIGIGKLGPLSLEPARRYEREPPKRAWCGSKQGGKP